MVHAELFHQQDALFDSLRIGGCTEGAECMVVGIALEEHLMAIEFETEVRAELDGADTELVAGLVGHRAVLAQQLGLRSI